MYEVHPELSFQAMAGVALAHGKHTSAGHSQRRDLLTAAGIVITADLLAARRAMRADILDAAAAWSARRIAAGDAVVLPDIPQRDESGAEIAIRY
jgi:predicted RNase H-like nuclease